MSQQRAVGVAPLVSLNKFGASQQYSVDAEAAVGASLDAEWLLNL